MRYVRRDEVTTVESDVCEQMPDLSRLGNQLGDIPAECEDEGLAISRVVQLVLEMTGAFGCAYVSRAADSRLAVQDGHYAPARLAQLPSMLQHVLRVAMAACSDQRAQVSPIPSDSLVVVAVPVRVSPHQNESLAVVITVEEPGTAQKVSRVSQTLQLIAAFIAQWRGQFDRATTADQLDRLRRLTQIQQQAAGEPDLQAGSQQVAEGLRDLYNCRTVAVGVRSGWHDRCKLLAVSDVGQFDRQTEIVKCMEDVMEETILRAELTELPDDATRDLEETTAVKRLYTSCNANFASCQPLRDATGRVFGAQLVLGGQQNRESLDRSMADSSPFIGTLLNLLVKRQPAFVSRQLQRLAIDRRIFRKPAFWITCAVVLAVMCAPLPYRISCRCEVQPVKRRYVAVPYEGRLDAALVDPGDIVRADQILARMDGREIHWELGTLAADLKRAEKDHDAAMADHDTAQAQIASLEAERLKLQILLLEDRLDNLEIKSPIEGIVISGDPKKTEGARMAMGQTILEVAPLTNMVVELEVDDQNISHVQAGQAVKFRLASHPFKSYEATISRIHPRSEQRDGKNIFVAEAHISNEDETLRPGMQGRAKITAARHMLAWNLFHRAWESALFRFGW